MIAHDAIYKKKGFVRKMTN